MTPYTPLDNFSAVSTYDINTPVLGGSAGDSNIPVKQLGDRTEYLANRLRRYLGHRIITGNDTITPADRGRLVHAKSTSNISLALVTVTDFRVGDIIAIKASTTSAGKAARIIPDGPETIEDGIVNHATNGLYLHDGEMIELMAGDADGDGSTDYWELVYHKSNLDRVGLDDMVRFIPRNAIVANGCNPEASQPLLLRTDYPRIWAIASATAILDSMWLSDPLRYRCFFSSGDGATTFRPPDMRGMFQRALDMGRGVTLDRLDNLAGGFESDAFKNHNHNNGNNDKLLASSGQDTGVAFDPSPGELNIKTGAPIQAAGGAETRPKNAGFTPVIYY